MGKLSCHLPAPAENPLTFQLSWNVVESLTPVCSLMFSLRRDVVSLPLEKSWVDG